MKRDEWLSQFNYKKDYRLKDEVWAVGRNALKEYLEATKMFSAPCGDVTHEWKCAYMSLFSGSLDNLATILESFPKEEIEKMVRILVRMLPGESREQFMADLGAAHAKKVGLIEAGAGSQVAQRSHGREGAAASEREISNS